MSWFIIVYRVLFLLHFILYKCDGAITSPPDGTQYVFLPGRTEKIKWEFDDDISNLIFWAWFFTSNDGSTEQLASVFRNGSTDIVTRLYEVDIERPSTLVLKNVNQSYNGAYVFGLRAIKTFTFSVTVFIAKRPTVTLNCSSATLNEDGDFICKCKGENGNPPAKVTWYKDDNQIGEKGTEKQLLILKDVDETDRGTYKCVAESYPDPLYRDEESITLVKLTDTSIKLNPNPAPLGQSFTITCSSTGLSKPTYKIFHNGSNIINTTQSHTIKNAAWSDAGEYECNAVNGVGTKKVIINLKVTDGPKDTSIKLKPNPAPLGESFTITCSSRGFPEPSYKISHNGSHLINTTKSHTISNVEWSHAGVYECRAENGVGPTDKASKTLNVTDTLNGSSDKDGPKDTSIKLNPNPAPLGESFTITCSSRGFPEPSYKISHNGSHLINTTKSHTISNVEWSHAGVYECRAENGVGPTDKASKTLNVTDTLNGSSDEGEVVEWHIVVSLLSGIIIGILFSYIVSCSRRRWCRNKKSERNSEPQADGVDTTYEELDLTKMNREDNYQSLRGSVAVRASNDAENDEESTYTQLSKIRDVENNYQSLT